MSKQSYWEETIEIAASECGLVLTEAQLQCLAGAAEASHDNYGLAFYSPPSSDMAHAAQRDSDAKYARLQKEFDEYRKNAEEAVRKALNQRSDAALDIGKYGQVTRYDGRSTIIQD